MVVIKKYSNRRLYDTDASSYITQTDIVNLINKNISFQVVDADKKDITSSILMQIILEKQTIGTNLIPEELLKKIILFNENNQASDMFGFLSNVLNFANLSGIFTKGFPGISKLKNFDFEKFFSRPFSNEAPKETKKKSDTPKPSNIESISNQLNNLQSQLDKIKKKKKKIFQSSF
tara:strand:- start:1314 stop:1841 length:528 start_codon:yes stop_codon:yes gene_type:complete